MHTTAQTILDGLTYVIHDAFPQAQIFADRVPQGMETATFFVRQISGGRKRRLGLLYSDGVTRNRMVQSNATFEITYFPAADAGKEENECRAVQEDLLDLLDIVPTADGAFIRGEDIGTAISDGVLVATVLFRYNTLWIPRKRTFGKLKFTLRGVK